MARNSASILIGPSQFINRWKASTLSERSGSQTHFIELCHMLGEETPTEADQGAVSYCFDKGVKKVGGGKGWADVWKRKHFGWEYKSKGKDLDEALVQLQRYALALENPPLLVVCDMERFRVHTNWTNTVSQSFELTLDDLHDPKARQQLQWVLAKPEKLKPGLTREALTRDAAQRFAGLAAGLRARGHDPQAVAHFVNRLVFCMFAEDAGLLENHLFSRMLEVAQGNPTRFLPMTRELFGAMKSGGMAGWEEVPWFNGGLFESDSTIPLSASEIGQVCEAAKLDWSHMDPALFGTLFEGGLDPDKRSQLGAHYTDSEKIRKIVEPVIERPLLADWQLEKARIATAMNRAAGAKTPGAATKAKNEAKGILLAFLEGVRRFRVLDPACGSGNFLYVALLALKDIEHRVSIEAEAMGLPREFPRVGPESVLGLEINPYAVELARISVWIGEIQWMQRNGFGVSRSPILRSLYTIECRDALLNPDGTEAEWPDANVIIGNPPFLGDKAMIGGLGEEYTQKLRRVYEGKVPGGADLVCYWFRKSMDNVIRKKSSRCGLVATNSIRGGANRVVLDRIVENARIFEAWSDEPWTLDGAAVRVSLVCFSYHTHDVPARLDAQPVRKIFPDLTGDLNLTGAKRLLENTKTSFIGTTKKGNFNISGRVARQWLLIPSNPNGRSNADVLKPWMNGLDVTSRKSDSWIVDFGPDMPIDQAMLFEVPFSHVEQHVKPARDLVRNSMERRLWWLHARAIRDLRSGLTKMKRFIGTPRVAKHRLFVWIDSRAIPDCQIVAIMRDDDTSFGILHSRFHQIWSLRLGSSLEDRPRYTPSTTFETFPFPEGFTPDRPASEYTDDPRAKAIAKAAIDLDEQRQRKLNPDDLVRIVPEVVSGFPDRILPKDDAAAAMLKKLTLTNLYNERPAWLVNAHRKLDEAVAAAYGWPADLPDDEVLARLLELNLARANAGVAPEPAEVELEMA